MGNRSVKVILDTNIWISFLITKNYQRFDELILNQKVQILFSKELIEEFLEVIERPKFKKFFSKKDISSILFFLDKNALFVNVKSSIKISIDPKDNFLFCLALDGKADYLITGDKELLELKKFKKTRVISFTDFLKTQR